MTILVFYGLSGSSFKLTKGVPEILAIVLSVILHIKTRNALLSIVIPTVFYMIFIQTFF
jgi:branched-subunit amino acid transport protein AzlD